MSDNIAEVGAGEKEAVSNNEKYQYWPPIMLSLTPIITFLDLLFQLISPTTLYIDIDINKENWTKIILLSLEEEPEIFRLW